MIYFWIWVFILPIVMGIQPLPNSMYMAYGYDAKVGQLVTDAIRMPIKQISYNQSQTVWMNNQEYLLPDHCNYVGDYERDANCSVSIFVSTNDVEVQLYDNMSMKIDPWFMPGMFSASYEYSYFSKQNKTNGMYTALSNQLFRTAQISCLIPTYTESFLEMIANLPLVYNKSTCPYYKKLFNYYGTHGFIRSIFGGMLQMHSSYKIDYYDSVTDEKVKEDLSMQFFFISFNGEMSSEQKKEYKSLSAIYTSTMQLMGGRPSTYDPEHWQQWADTIDSNPIPLVFDVQPIYDMFPFNSGLKDATIAYLQSGLDDYHTFC